MEINEEPDDLLTTVYKFFNKYRYIEMITLTIILVAAAIIYPNLF